MYFKELVFNKMVARTLLKLKGVNNSTVDFYFSIIKKKWFDTIHNLVKEPFLY